MLRKRYYGNDWEQFTMLTLKHFFQAFFILMTTGKVIADAGSMSNDTVKGSNAVKSGAIRIARVLRGDASVEFDVKVMIFHYKENDL